MASKDKSASKDKAAADKKDKKDKKDKADKKDKPSKDKSDTAAAGGETKTVGATVYVKHKVKSDDKKTTITLWAPQGVPPTNKEMTYRELKDESGTGKPYYVLLSAPTDRKWELPDIKKPSSAAAAASSSSAAGPVELEKKKFKERKEWTDDNAKKPVINLVKKLLLEPKNAGKLNDADYATMCTNVAKEYMSLFKKLDATGEKWIAEKCATDVHEWMERKKVAEAAQAKVAVTASLGRKSLTAPLSKEIQPIPLAPATVPKKPSSPLLGRADYIRDPYYSVRLLHKNSRRTTLEPSIESTLFHQPGAGTIKVLGAVLTKVGPAGEKNMMVAVIRDWVGAYVLLMIEPPNEHSSEAVVAGAYPILEHVEFPMVGHSKVKVVIDDNPIIMSFRDQDSASYLHECLKAAMCSMFQQGTNDDRIVAMRAYSVELSSVDTSYYPDGQVPDPKAVVQSILAEDIKDGAQMDDQFAALRLCLRTAPGRDTVLRHWVKSVDEGTVLRKKTESMMNNHLRVIDEAIRHPTESEDPVVCGNVLARLQMLRTDKNRSRVDAMKLAFRIVTNVMQDWKSRDDQPDVPFEMMFYPVDNSPAAIQDEAVETQRRTAYARSQVPPGIYLTLLVYHGNHVLCDPLGNLFSEVIVPSPSDAELEQFHADSPDFRWVMSLGPGGSSDWALTEAPSWAEVFEHAGKQTFQFRFLHAARRLLEGLPFGTLGVLFDTPVVHRKVGTAHVVTIIRVDSKESVPTSVGDWKSVNDFDMQLALQSCVVPSTARVRFLPSGYYNTVRVAKAAIEYRETVDKRLPSGFYFGLVAVASTTNGMQLLVPEGNRNAPPLIKVSDDMPTIEQWRWIQSLNERKRRSGDFGLEMTTELANVAGSHAAFEHSFAKAIDEVERGTGLKVEKFYDHEIFVMDEARQVRGIFGVCVAGKSLERDPIFDRPIPRRPQGLVPMVWKNLGVVDASYLAQYFPRVGGNLLAERAAHFRRSVSTCQPYSLDELCRLQQDAALTCWRDVDKFLIIISWARIVSRWTIHDFESIVEANGGVARIDDTIVRSIEESVEIAVSNAATNQDINVNTLKSLLLDSGGQLHFSFPTLLSKLREVDRVITLGYGQRTVTGSHAQGAPKNKTLRVRTCDELNTDEDSDDDEPRAATVYEVPCTLEELVLKDASSEIADRYFQIQELVYDIVDAACVDCVDVGEVKEVGNIISDMISIIESSEDLLDHASLLALKKQVEDSAVQERREFQKKWLEAFKDEGDGVSLVTSTSNAENDERQALLEDVELDNPLASPLYYDGSSRAVRSFNEGLRVCMARASNTASALENLMKVASSAIEVLDLVRCVQDFSSSVSKRQSLLRNTSALAGTISSIQQQQQQTPAGQQQQQQQQGTPAGGTTSMFNQSNRLSVAAGGSQSPATLPGGQAASVILVSKEYTEFPLAQVDPLRCLVLLGVNGKIRFPTVSASSLQHIANHLQERDFVVPQQLQHLQLERAQAESLLEVSFQMKAPLLCLRLITMLFASVDGAVGGSAAPFFSPTTSIQLRGLLLDSFFFEYGIKDWLQMELLGADAISTAMDLLWWIRFVKEATADRLTLAGRDTFGDHEGEWKKMYAETRVRVFTTFGVHAISKDEVALWAEHIGRLVEYLTFRETAVSDAEVEVVATCCPNIRSIDLSKTKISSQAIDLLVLHCPLLVECSVVGCDLPQSALESLRRHATEAAAKIQALEQQSFNL